MAIAAPLWLLAQNTILKGKITDAATKEAMAGATVTLLDYNLQTQTDANGSFSFNKLRNGNYQIQITFLGFKPLVKNISINGETQVDLALEKALFLADEVIVSATRASANSATTYKNLSKADIEKNNFGQDLPFLLNQTPSVVVTSDAGAGIGYTGIRIRGSDATRINVTINGIPYNDTESQGTFWVNLPDFASSVDNIQIQRGVGTSTNGAGAFGASLNIQTSTRNDSAFAEVNNSIGSFGTIKNTLKIGTGLINGKFSIDGRLSRIKSDGFIDRAFSDLKSFYVSGAYYGKSSILRANVFSGAEQTYQSWTGVPEAKLRGSQADLLTHYFNNLGSAYFTQQDSLNLFNSNPRKYNSYLYDNQTDNYQQDHYQLLYAKEINSQLSFNGALHYTRGRGYYEEFKHQEDFEDYGFAPFVIGAETIDKTDLVRRRWLDNDFYGLTYSLNYKPSKALDFTLGGAYNEYKGAHFGEVIWARFAQLDNNKQRYYDNDATKTDFNVFGKATYTLNNLSIYTDLQYRSVDYSFLGFNNAGDNVQQRDILNFFNPKFGLTYQIDKISNVYASFARANKEPNRDDYTESSPGSRPLAERLDNIEVGYRYLRKNVTAGFNLYGMFYKDQLILTGEVNDVGAYVRDNVDRSYRIGAEFDAKWQIFNQLSWAATATLSQNRIKRFSEFFDIYDADFDFIGQAENQYTNTDIAFSPSFIASNEFAYKPIKALEIALLTKYVSDQYLDNTSNNARKLDAFFVNDLRLSHNLKFRGVKNVNLSLLVNNIFNEKYESNGYTFGYIYDNNLITENYYYPQAGTNFLLSLSAKF
nr:TonB-dependent receptor [Pedobacter glucosidilyticus]